MNNRVFGCYAEYKFAVMAMEKGLLVSFPILHTSVYDCIVDSNKGLSKVQIKAVDQSNRQRNRVMLQKTNGNGYDLKEVDFFAVYSKERDGFYIFKNKGLQVSLELSSEKYSIYFNNFALF